MAQDLLKKKYPNYIPVLIYPYRIWLPSLTQPKHLVHKDINLWELIFHIKKKLNLSLEKQMEIYHNNKVCPKDTRVAVLLKVGKPITLYYNYSLDLFEFSSDE